MHLRLPRSLHYPITVTELLKQPNETVPRLAPLFSYVYRTTVTEGDRFGGLHQVEKAFPTRYESPVEGVLKAWKIEKGAVIVSYDVEVAEIEEPCPHSVQFAGMCTMCGKDMTALSYNTDILNVDRATINMVHDNMALTISQDEASRVEEEAKRRLLKSKKLSLVVDLDQTIIHATVDPTVAEWQQDPQNPNHGAVKSVCAFQLTDDGPGARGCWYYIKLRPGLADFLEQVSKLYELHIYTMGTRAYAQSIAAIVDPDRKIFGDRILSRDESGSLTAKSLQRLFPVDTKMVVIIDDRADVWQWSHNLIKVVAYDFFVGIGDINSSFLPKRPELPSPPRIVLRLTPPKPLPPPNDDRAAAAAAAAAGAAADAPASEKTTAKEDEADGDPDAEKAPEAVVVESGPTASAAVVKPSEEVSTLDQLVSMSAAGDPATLQHQASLQDEALAAQLEDRPLLRKQALLDAEDDAAAEAAAAAAAAAHTERPADGHDHDGDGDGDPDAENREPPPPPDPPRHRQNLLHDNDSELRHLERNLRDVHHAFFDAYDGQMRQQASTRDDEPDRLDLDMVPDVKSIMPAMKQRALKGAVLVFSGVVPLGSDLQRSDIALWAKSFGARVSERITRRTTHLVAARDRTTKVRLAARRPQIHIVTIRWLLDSISQWRWLDEDPYLIAVDPADREPLPPSTASPSATPSSSPPGGPGSREGPHLAPDPLLLSETDADDDDDEDDDNEKEKENGDGDVVVVVDVDEDMRPPTVLPDDDDDDDVDDPEGVRPADLEDNQSPIDGAFFTDHAWQEIDTELAEFLGSDGDDDDKNDDDDDDESDDGRESRDSRDSRDGREHGHRPLDVPDASASPSTARKRKRLRSRSRSRSSTPSLRLPSSAPATEKEKGMGMGMESGAARFAKRQQLARQRSTGLKAVTSADAVEAGDNVEVGVGVGAAGSTLPTPEKTSGEGEGEGEAEGETEREGEGEGEGEGEEGSIIDERGPSKKDALPPSSSSAAAAVPSTSLSTNLIPPPAVNDDDDDDDDDALERALEAEMEKEMTMDHG
ncbi:MAG: Carboxy-terminal domain (CTD) phosphatase [Phylliscum demangeonii]|nr:MAG: Carboxy-terminal domain (CTD) phosphatase [Phylliscum demangeonii]